MFLKFHQHGHIHSLQKNGWSGSLLFCSVILKCMLNNVLLFITFSKSPRRLTQTYLYKFMEMILRNPVQCNMAEFSEGTIC